MYKLIIIDLLNTYFLLLNSTNLKNWLILCRYKCNCPEINQRSSHSGSARAKLLKELAFWPASRSLWPAMIAALAIDAGAHVSPHNPLMPLMWHRNSSVITVMDREPQLWFLPVPSNCFIQQWIRHWLSVKSWRHSWTTLRVSYVIIQQYINV